MGAEIKARNALTQYIGCNKNAPPCARNLIKAKVIFIGIQSRPIGFNSRHPAPQKDAKLQTSNNIKFRLKTAIFRPPRP